MEAADEGKHRDRYRYMDDPLRKFMYHMQVHSMNLYSGSRGHVNSNVLHDAIMYCQWVHVNSNVLHDAIRYSQWIHVNHNLQPVDPC
jgi:hypothetical protein